MASRKPTPEVQVRPEPPAGLESVTNTEADAREAEEKARAQHQRVVEAHALALNTQAATFSAAIGEMGNLLNSWFTGVQGFDQQNFSGDLMLVVTELAEACEGDRKPHRDEHCPDFDNREVEVADALVRLLHLAAKYQLRLAPAFFAKMRVNLARPMKHGKGY